MRRQRVFLASILPAMCLFAVHLAPVFAGTTVIRVETEGVGVINKDTGEQNSNGAMVWNGTEWVVNNTWAHQFFLDTRTGQRLKEYNSKDVTVSGFPTPEEAGGHDDGYGAYYEPQSFGNYSITAQSYWYTKTATSGACGAYHYGSVEYRIIDNVTGKAVILRSRGVGGGTAQAYLDVYIDDETDQTTAMLNDPAWYTYPGPTNEALNQLPDERYHTGNLPSVNAALSTGLKSNGYYLDIADGADLGPQEFGKSYELHTAALATKFSALSPSYVNAFELKWMDSSGNLQKITVSPTLIWESFIPGPCARVPAPAVSWPVLAALAVLLTATGARLARRR